MRVLPPTQRKREIDMQRCGSDRKSPRSTRRARSSVVKFISGWRRKQAMSTTKFGGKSNCCGIRDQRRLRGLGLSIPYPATRLPGFRPNIWPLVLTTTSSTGMSAPEISRPFLTIIGNPEQQGTSITTVVMLLMPALRKTCANLSIYFWASSSFGHPIITALPFRKSRCRLGKATGTQSARTRRSAPFKTGLSAAPGESELASGSRPMPVAGHPPSRADRWRAMPQVKTA